MGDDRGGLGRSGQGAGEGAWGVSSRRVAPAGRLRAPARTRTCCPWLRRQMARPVDDRLRYGCFASGKKPHSDDQYNWPKREIDIFPYGDGWMSSFSEDFAGS